MDFMQQRGSGGGTSTANRPPSFGKSFVKVTSYQRSISNGSSQPDSPSSDLFGLDMELPPLPLPLPPLPPLTLPPLSQPPNLLAKHHWTQQQHMFSPQQHQSTRASPMKGRGMGCSQESASSGYASCSSSSSLFPALRKAPSEKSLLFATTSHNVADKAPMIHRFVAEQQQVQKEQQQQEQQRKQRQTAGGGGGHKLGKGQRPGSNGSTSGAGVPSSKAAFLKESLIRVLDQVDARVSFLRETANELEEEKRKLTEALANVETNRELSLIEEVDREEILITSHRLIRMLNTVNVQVTTIRDKEQQLALEAVSALLANVSRMSEVPSERDKARQMCRLYLNTCSSESYCLPVDEKFQRAIIECAADDQKRTRKRLETLLANIGQQMANK